MKQRKILLIATATFALLSSFYSTSAHAERWVYLNDQRLGDPEIANLEQLNCVGIPNGRYWTQGGYYRDQNWPAGQWLPVGYCCYNHCRHPSLSERGLLFSPRDWLK